MMSVAGGDASRQARAWRLGLFVLAGLGLLLAAAVALLGRNLFTPHENLSFEFTQSVQGLKAGSAVLLRGVRVGQVQRLALSAPSVLAGAQTEGTASAPMASVVVAAEVERAALQALLGSSAINAAMAAQNEAMAAGASGPALQRTLVQRGLVARLASQSLLTGQAVVELDMGAAPSPAALAAMAARAGSAPLRIPTEASGLSALQRKLEGLDVVGLADEMRQAAAATRQLAASASLATSTVANAPLAPTLEEFKSLAADLRRLAVQLDGKAGRISESASSALAGTLGQVRRSAEQWGAVAAPAASAAERATRAAASVQALAEGAQTPLNQSLASARQAADELAQTAAALRASVAPDSPLVQDIDRAAREAAQAARSVRALADALEKNPSSLVWGRARPSGVAPSAAPVAPP